MSKFRLAWARQCGERKAKELGFSRFPIDPFAIAEGEDIMVVPKQPDHPGVSGGIIFGDQVGIFYATDITSQGFQRFTVGHELGHYFLEGHPAEILKSAPLHVSSAGFTEGGTSIELEADHFASGLLMPSVLVRKLLDRERIGLESIEALADASLCSLTAAAIRTAECSADPVAIIVSRGEVVCYAFLSERFKKLGRLDFLRKGDTLPETLTRRFNARGSNVIDRERACDAVSLRDWFGTPSEVELDEQVLGLGRYGLTLTILTSDAPPPDPAEEKNEEEQLIESYTPKFAYGR